MKVFEFVLAVIVITGIFQIIRYRMGMPSNVHPKRWADAIAGREQQPVEDDRLRAELRQLKERVQVLERIATDKEDTLSRQIESLRDR
jgi:hypothetical protein